MDLYETALLESAAEKAGWTKQDALRIATKIQYAVDVGIGLMYLEPGRKTSDGIDVRSLAISKRAKDGHIFVAIRASRNLGKKNEEKLVGFGSGLELDVALYELAHRFKVGTIKWRPDTPFEPDDPNDRAEKLPKWGIPDGV